jgi:hypothetical protein
VGLVGSIGQVGVGRNSGVGMKGGYATVWAESLVVRGGVGVRHRLVALLVVVILSGCGGQQGTGDPYTVVEGPWRVRLEVEPVPAREGQEVFFVFLVADAATGEPVETVRLRPMVDMSMPDNMRMSVPLGELEPTSPGEFRASTVAEHVGTLRVTVNVVDGSLVRPVPFPPIPVER